MCAADVRVVVLDTGVNACLCKAQLVVGVVISISVFEDAAGRWIAQHHHLVAIAHQAKNVCRPTALQIGETEEIVDTLYNTRSTPHETKHKRSNQAMASCVRIWATFTEVFPWRSRSDPSRQYDEWPTYLVGVYKVLLQRRCDIE